MHRRHVLGSTSINTSLEKGSANIKAPNTGIVYVPIRARRGLSTSSRPSFAACRNALEDDYKVQDTGIAYRPNRATSDRLFFIFGSPLGCHKLKQEICSQNLNAIQQECGKIIGLNSAPILVLGVREY